MKTTLNLTRLTLWITHLVALVIAVFLFVLPPLLNWYCTLRNISIVPKTMIAVAFYVSVVPITLALWQFDTILRNLLKDKVFLKENVRRIRIIQWCCFAVSLICLPAALFYYPLIFLVVIMGFLSLVVAVVCRVMDEAVAIREENDLTI
jgi:hypothetical protein